MISSDMKSIQAQIKRLHFSSAYETLYTKDYSFNFEELARDFPKIDSQKMYMFLMYAISQKEDVEKHLAICYYLYFRDPYIVGADHLIRWHLIQALKLSPYDERVLKNWIFGVYSGNPDCPFTKKELEDYKCRLYQSES